MEKPPRQESGGREELRRGVLAGGHDPHGKGRSEISIWAGCLSDGVLGSWLALVCGVGQILDRAKVASHLKAIHKYNLKHDLSDYPNPQRPSYACGREGGLLLCTWPKGGELALPFVYSNEVWTGIEYQVAAHLMRLGLVNEGLDIVRTCRDRYDGEVRNPFNEDQCGHWYARAMSSYALLQGLAGARYDAVDKLLYIEPSVAGDFRAFFAAGRVTGPWALRMGRLSTNRITALWRFARSSISRLGPR